MKAGLTRWPALAQWPGMVRSARAGVPDTAIRAALADGGWEPEHSRPTMSDTAVLMVRTPDGTAGVLKVTVTASGVASLRREREILSRLRAQQPLAGWRELLPAPVRWGETTEGAYLLTSRLPGRDSRDIPAAGTPDLTREALAAISVLHQHGQVTAAVDAARLRRWVDEPAAMLRTAVRDGSAVDRMATALTASLTGATVTLGWTHGDFHPGNVLTDADGHVSGIVDWDQADEQGLTAADLVFWLLTVPEDGRSELGARVVRRLRAAQPFSDAELSMLTAPGGTSPFAMLPHDHARTLLVLTWLWHVAGNLAKSGRYARSPVWLHRNVRPVLRQVGEW